MISSDGLLDCTGRRKLRVVAAPAVVDAAFKQLCETETYACMFVLL
jgi:hypothetical protein